VLVEQNRAEIRYLLGWPFRFFQDDTRLEKAMDSLNSYTLSSGDSTTEARVLALVTEAKTALTAATATQGILMAVDASGSSKLDRAREWKGQLATARRAIRELSATLSVPVQVDITCTSAGRGPTDAGFAPWG